MAQYYAGNVSEYADGDRRVIVCDDIEVGFFKIGENFYAWHNRCAHRAGPVCQGRSRSGQKKTPAGAVARVSG
jgi:nitrite reductase/ring-hydroxylating ferredoxin subunit